MVQMFDICGEAGRAYRECAEIGDMQREGRDCKEQK